MIHFGADYYPEHWPENRWEIDAQLMAEAGFNVVRLAEFAWAKMEPQEGVFDFIWLDHAIEVLNKQGIHVVLGTPTAVPPAWLAKKHPDIFRVREDGVRAGYGARRMNCPNHSAYRDYSRKITSAMAEHFAKNPAVIGWQIDNEFGDRCYCDICQKEFQNWAYLRYGTLENLNECWGTVFWSHTYTEWSQIPLPLSTIGGGPPNPGLSLDFRRFVSDSYAAFQQEQITILRALAPDHFITHNMMGFGYDNLNYFDLARPLDFVSWDNYPYGFWSTNGNPPFLPALSHDTMRGLKNKNFWVMEQQAGPSGWEKISLTPRPGMLRLWAYQALAHGADGIVFFRWRTARFGAEQYWHGILEHDGRIGRRYDEIKQLGLELKRIGEKISGAETISRVAMIQSYDSRFAFQIQENSSEFSYGVQFSRIYAALWKCGICVDIISPDNDYSKYDLVIAPALHVLTDDTAAHLRDFVQAGGTVMVTPRTGVKDAFNAVVNQPLPGLLSEVCGVIVKEYDAIPSTIQQAVVFETGELDLKVLPVEAWCDILQPQTARVLARFTQEYYAGEPAITGNSFGKGEAFYLGAFGDDDFYSAIIKWLLERKSIHPVLKIPDGLEVAERWKDHHCYRFYLNHSSTPRVIELQEAQFDVLDNAMIKGKVEIKPNEVLIVYIP